MADSEDKLKIVVGLGNPGAKYNRTRHNIGFQVIDKLSSDLGASLPNAKFEGEVTSTQIDQNRLVLVKPLTFMNCSGRCVAAFAKFYKINVTEDLLIVCDDLSLPLGKLRTRPKGSAGGQNGLKDILQSLSTQEIARLRIGIDQPPPRWDAADYVLGKFREDEQASVEEAVKTATEAIRVWCLGGISHCMNQFN